MGSVAFRTGAVVIYPVDKTEDNLGELRLADRTWLDRRILLTTVLLIGPMLLVFVFATLVLVLVVATLLLLC